MRSSLYAVIYSAGPVYINGWKHDLKSKSVRSVRRGLVRRKSSHCMDEAMPIKRTREKRFHHGQKVKDPSRRRRIREQGFSRLLEDWMGAELRCHWELGRFHSASSSPASIWAVMWGVPDPTMAPLDRHITKRRFSWTRCFWSWPWPSSFGSWLHECWIRRRCLSSFVIHFSRIVGFEREIEEKDNLDNDTNNNKQQHDDFLWMCRWNSLCHSRYIAFFQIFNHVAGALPKNQLDSNHSQSRHESTKLSHFQPWQSFQR